MNILLCSVPYPPSVGGIETVSALLVEQFHRAGHDVTVVTRTPSDQADATAWRVVRRPGARQLIALHRWADVVLHSNISLRFAWPLLMVRRPWVVAHHTWLKHGPRTTLAARAKRFALRFAHNLAVSHALAESLAVPAEVVPNPYAHGLFRPDDSVPRERDLVFVGRLVDDKGLHVLIDALGLLRDRGRRLHLTVVGDGPDRVRLEVLARQQGIDAQLVFLGRRAPAQVVDQLRRHRICVVPSVWEEPFGLIAIEALACGCVPVVSRSGGLPEAIGSLGRVVPKGDAQALADGLIAALEAPLPPPEHAARTQEHLARHRAGAVAARYLNVLANARREHLLARAA